jgi:hypothetical protein
MLEMVVLRSIVPAEPQSHNVLVKARNLLMHFDFGDLIIFLLYPWKCSWLPETTFAEPDGYDYGRAQSAWPRDEIPDTIQRPNSLVEYFDFRK